MSSDSIMFGQLIYLVQEMRLAQREYFALTKQRGVAGQQFALTRALQKSKSAEKRVDDWLAQHAEDEKRLGIWNGKKKHSEQAAFYETEIGNGK